MLMHPDLQRHVDKYYGKYSGEVTENNLTDEEGDNKVGRIKVKVPPVFGKDTEVIARPCLPFGHFFIPSIGAKVWVEFEAGDPNFPIWVGTWYPTGSTPEDAAITPPDNRVIQTPSGHTIEIMDKDGEEKILIKHKDNAFISIDKNGSVLISNPKGSLLFLNAQDEAATFMEQHGNLITMTSKGVLIVNTDGSTLELKGDTVNILAKNIVLSGTSVALGANASEPTILGQTFAPLYAAHTHATAMGPSGPPLPPVVPPIPWLSSSVVVK